MNYAGIEIEADDEGYLVRAYTRHTGEKELLFEREVRSVTINGHEAEIDGTLAFSSMLYDVDLQLYARSRLNNDSGSEARIEFQPRGGE